MYDVLIKNAQIIDGTGADAYRADVALRKDRIAAIGQGLSGAKLSIDASGLTLTPGFFDVHSHADLTALMYPDMEAYLKQGVTTVIGGNCGHSMAPMGNEIYRSAIVDFPVTALAEPKYFDLVTLMLPREKAAKAWKELFGIDMDWNSLAEYRAKCNKNGLGCNIAPLIGYSAVRQAVMGADCMREADAGELDALASMVERCMKEGAFGLSTGLDPQYIPGLFATDEETVRMLEIVKKHGGIFTSHTFNTRMDGTGSRMDGYRTMLEQALAAGVKANVSHVHVLGMAASPEDGAKAAQDTLAYFEEMAGRGLDLSFDVIPSPYSTDFTIPYFAFFLRPFVKMSGSRAHLAENFKVPDFRKMIHTVVEAGMFPVFDPKQPVNYYPLLMVLRHKNPEYAGKIMGAYAAEKGINPLDLLMDMFSEDPDMEANVAMAGFAEANNILCASPIAMPCSDSFGCGKNTNFTGDAEIPLYPNPMSISFIPRFLLCHGRKRFEDTIRQVSGYPAERFGVKERGLIKEGFFADLVLLDLDKLHSHDMDENPMQYPDGIPYVFVNGTCSVEKGAVQRIHSGKMLSKR